MLANVVNVKVSRTNILRTGRVILVGYAAGPCWLFKSSKPARHDILIFWSSAALPALHNTNTGFSQAPDAELEEIYSTVLSIRNHRIFQCCTPTQTLIQKAINCLLDRIGQLLVIDKYARRLAVLANKRNSFNAELKAS